MTIDAGAHGVFPIAPTPFRDDGTIDLASLDRLMDWFVELGVSGITLLGFMGEANRLSEDESLNLVRHALRRIDLRVPAIVGVNQGSFDGFHAFADSVIAAGAAALMVSPPAGLRTEEQVLSYFDGLIRRLGGAVPLVLQDYPQNSGVFLSVQTLSQLFERHPCIQVFKHEEAAALNKLSRIRAEQERSGRALAILTGNSAIHLPQELRRGANGANTGVAFPEMLIEVCRRFAAGDADRGEDLYDIFLPLIRHEQQPGVGLAIRKEVFRRRGLITTARTRAPGPTLNATDQTELTDLLARLARKLEASGEADLVSTYKPGPA